MTSTPPNDSAENSPCPSVHDETEESIQDPENCCGICEEEYKNPKLLGCLHHFCTECLEKDLEKQAKEKGLPTIDMIICFACKQETYLGNKGVNGLRNNIFKSGKEDTANKEEVTIPCTSCKAGEKAVARCSDCANFLCPNCVMAHQFMRCFENHKVVQFDDMNEADGAEIEKPMFCPNHQTAPLKVFCLTCQELVCPDCVMESHPPPTHNCERMDTFDIAKVNEELLGLVNEAKSKVKYCEDASDKLEGCLTELQEQRDNAKSLIQETFQSYKAALEKQKDKIMNELDEVHSKQELNIMDAFNGVTKTLERIEDGCGFTETVMKNGTLAEVLSFKKLISTQLMSLINNLPKTDVSVKIVFETDQAKFEQSLEDHFGKFEKESNPLPEVNPDTNVSSLQSSFENEPTFNIQSMINSNTASLLQDDFPALPNLPAPLNLGGISTLTSQVTVPPVSSSIASSIANIDHRSISRNSHSPAASDSGISVDGPGSSGSGANTPQVNLVELAKHGSLGVNAQGQITLNGQVIQGLNINNLNMNSAAPRSATPTSGAATPASEVNGDLSIQTLASLLGGPTPLPSSGRQTPQQLDIAGLLTRANSLSLAGPVTPTGLTGIAAGPLTPGGSSTFADGATGGAMSNVRGSGRANAMQIRYKCKFGQLGPGKGQFNSPHGFCLGLEEDIVVADTNNHRVQVFEKTGEFKYQFGIPGREEGQLWYPRKVAVIRHSGKYVVCDRGNERSRMQIFTKNGHFIKKIAIRYIDIVAGLAITHQGHIVAVDSVSPTVFVIAETGDLVKWFDCSDYMREPSDIAINSKEYFVCDFKGHCVVVFNEDGQFLRRIGCENITNFPNGIDISDAGDVLVGDSHGNRFHVAVFQRDGSLIGEFECPYVKVSRCCGLKITSEGYIVTLAKNNHHVLVLHTLYIT